jgi:signal transduction histidine kinase
VEISATLKKIGDYIRVFASNVSHEFKTPLTSIRGTVELLKDHLGDMSDEDRSRFLQMLEQDADRLEKLIRLLLDLARAEVVQPGVERTSVAGAFDRIRARFRSEGLNVTFDARPDAPPVPMGAEVLDSILSNLVDNARRHGGPQVNVHLSGRWEKRGAAHFVEIAVQDDGPGVPLANAEKIFTPFFTTARQSGGVGLGLAVVQALLAAHRGTIVLEKSRSGALFHISLPAAAGNSEQCA